MRASRTRSWVALLSVLLCTSTALAQRDAFDEGFDDGYEAPPQDVDDEPRGGASVSDGASVSEQERADAFRSHNSWRGATGGVHLLDAGSGLPGSFRVQLGLEGFSASDFLTSGDEHSHVGGVLSLSWTVIDHLEVFATIANHATSNTEGDPVLLQVLGDTTLGAKGYYAIQPWLIVGGDLSLVFLNSVGDIGLVTDGTGFRFGLNLSADLRKKGGTPLILRFNTGYYFDNSANLTASVEDARYQDLDDPAANKNDEVRHLLTRQERFGLGINRLDTLSFGLGLEAPLKVSEGFFLQPLAEYTLGYPINRQGYVCLVETTDASVSQPDGCLEFQGFAAMPSNLTLGVRAFPPLNGLGLMLAFDIGLSGVNTFVRELHANQPYNVMFSLSYAYDTAPPPTAEAPVEVVKTVEVLREPPPKARIAGVVVEQGLGDAIEGAIVRYPDLDLTAQATNSAGRFISYGMEPGDVQVEVSHPDYEPRVCVVTIPAQASASELPSVSPPATTAPAGALGPVTAEGKAVIEAMPESTELKADAVGGIGRATEEQPSAPAASPAGPFAGGATAPLIELRCELTAKPRFGKVLGTVTSEEGAPVAGAAVQLSGPTSASTMTDASGRFRAENLPSGSYSVRVDAEGYLLKLGSATVTANAEAAVTLQLAKKPKNAQVSMSKQEVKIRRQIMFKSNSAEIAESSFPLLSEIADVLMRNPQVKRVEIQGHTDNIGDPNGNKMLSQQRAESVMQWLVQAGVDGERLSAKGYGDLRPLVPNLTPGNRARNRRVQFMILDQE